MAAVVLKSLVAAVALPIIAVSASGRMGEGEDLLIELADAVLANKQAILPIPWDIVKDRDVGYVGEHPLLENSSAVGKLESLGTQREVEKGLSPVIAIGTVYIKDTDQPPSPPAVFRMGESVGGEDKTHLSGVVNPTSELTVWQWQRIKYFATKEWLEGWSVRYPDKLVLLHSSGDVLYGGCDENSIKYKYDQIVNASGGTQTIVVSAEVSPYPSSVGWKYATTSSLEAKRTSVLDKWGLTPGWASAHASCTGGVNSVCDSTPKYQYATSGVIMGPVSDVLEMLSSLSQYSGLENQLISEYFFENPDKVTLDYGGVLSLSLHNMVKSDGSVPVEIVDTAGVKSLKSKVTNEKVCFVHGNGNSFPALKTLAAGLKA